MSSYKKPNNKFGDVPTLFSLDKKTSKASLAPPTKLEPEFAEHYNAWSNNQGPAQNDAIVAKLQPVIDSALKTYVGQDVPPSVRLQSKRMAIEALKSYDPSKAKLKTHMMWHLQGLKRAATKANQILNVPERVQLDLNNLNMASNELSEKLGRDPSDSELADFTGLSVGRMTKIRAFKPGIAEGAATESMFSGGEETMSDPSVIIPGRDTGNAWRGFVYDSLDPRSKIIMEHSLGMHNKQILDNKAIARKLRLTPARVSQIRSDIQSKLDSRERLGLL